MDGATENVGAVVLAGGRSERMGADKAGLEFCGRRMIDVVVGALREITDRVVVVTKLRHDLALVDAIVLEDEEPFAGPLPALVAGLRLAATQRNAVVACDLPFVNADLLRLLTAGLTDDIDAVVPIADDRPQPLHAAYGDCAIEPLLASIAAGERSLRGALERLRVRWMEEDDWRPIDPEGRSFMNVNTPEELQSAIALQTATT